jgi:hypothetical protein
VADNDEYQRGLAWLARVRQKVSDGTIGATATAVTSLARPVINWVTSKAGRESALHALIREILGDSPNITRADLIERLRREKGYGVIDDVDDAAEEVSWAPSKNAALKTASFKSIGEMKSRIRREL